jgi:2-dehydropantoate 2-reductase
VGVHDDRVGVVGVGAIGATLAASVQRTGRATLVLCGRTAVPRVLVESADGGSVRLDAPVLTDPDGAGRVDWVLLAVKAHQTESAADWLRELVDEDTVVVVLQNGVEHRERVAPLAPRGAVVPAVVWYAAQRTGPGRVRTSGSPRLSLPDCAESRRFADLMDGSGADIELVEDFLTEAWRKLCVNAVGGLMALAGRPADMFRGRDVQALTLALLEECAEVGRAEGAKLPRALAAEIADDWSREAPDSGSSILADRLAGRPLEWDARNGVIRRLGARHGIPTPISDVIVPILAATNG